MHSIFKQALLINNSKLCICNCENAYNVQKGYKETCTYGTASIKASLDSSNLLSHIISASIES